MAGMNGEPASTDRAPGRVFFAARRDAEPRWSAMKMSPGVGTERAHARASPVLMSPGGVSETRPGAGTEIR